MSAGEGGVTSPACRAFRRQLFSQPVGRSVNYAASVLEGCKIAAQDYNISVSTYVEQEDKREVVNITALNAEIEHIVARGDVLRREINAIIAEIEGESML